MLLFALACASAPEGPPSIVLVSLDTTRADRLGAYGNPDGLTPSLDRFASEAVTFTHAYSQTNETLESHASVFTSRYPCDDRRAAPALAEILHTYGYRTGAFVGGGDLAPGQEVERGFQTYVSPTEFGSFWHTEPLAEKWLAEADGPSFAFVHSYDAHARYLEPTPFATIADVSPPVGMLLQSPRPRVIDGRIHPDTRGLATVANTWLRPRSPGARGALAELARDAPRLTDDDLAAVRQAYDEGVAYLDVGFGMLMAALQSQGRLDDTWVVVMGDHGEQLGEDGLFDHPFGLGDPETHVPLLVRAPKGEGGGRRVDAVVELTDILPTLVAIAGGVPPAGMRGTSLLPAIRGEPFEGHAHAFSVGGAHSRMVSVRGPEGRLTYTGVSAGAALLPELVANAALPGPGFTGDPDPALRDALVATLKTVPVKNVELPQAPLRAALKEHGYF